MRNKKQKERQSNGKKGRGMIPSVVSRNTKNELKKESKYRCQELPAKTISPVQLCKFKPKCWYPVIVVKTQPLTKFNIQS
jgi:hypothetical protein